MMLGVRDDLAGQRGALGRCPTRSGCKIASIAPHLVWPQTMTLATCSTSTAYSIAAETPPRTPRCTDGTMLPTLRTIKSSPGAALVMRFGTTRESLHVM